MQSKNVKVLTGFGTLDVASKGITKERVGDILPEMCEAYIRTDRNPQMEVRPNVCEASKTGVRGKQTKRLRNSPGDPWRSPGSME